MDYLLAKQQLIQAYQTIRHKTEELCLPLAEEDLVAQSVDDVNPPKWHLAHTSWFFETFVLPPQLAEYSIFHPLFHYLFNSYHERVHHVQPTNKDALLARPRVKTVFTYRKHVDTFLLKFLEEASEKQINILQPLITLGLHHEQQHQELLLMDIKHNFFHVPHFPAYRTHAIKSEPEPLTHQAMQFVEMPGGTIHIGSLAKEFCFDNELPRHQHILKPYQFATRLVTNHEFCEFIEADGYNNERWWSAEGWEQVRKNNWQAPLYWQKIQKKWYVFTLSGLQELESTEPVVHVSYYEAEAYAKWRDCRLPSEAEWEHFVTHHGIAPSKGNFLESRAFHPQASFQAAPYQLFGDVWEWTSSPYAPYPGYQPMLDTISEYNGKFMHNQMVLRGGSCVTPQTHIRETYRNFFQADKRWQFSGIRLATGV